MNKETYSKANRIRKRIDQLKRFNSNLEKINRYESDITIQLYDNYIKETVGFIPVEDMFLDYVVSKHKENKQEINKLEQEFGEL